MPENCDPCVSAPISWMCRSPSFGWFVISRARLFYYRLLSFFHTTIHNAVGYHRSLVRMLCCRCWLPRPYSKCVGPGATYSQYAIQGCRFVHLCRCVYNLSLSRTLADSNSLYSYHYQYGRAVRVVLLVDVECILRDWCYRCVYHCLLNRIWPY